MGLARLGHRVLLASCWGDDRPGHLLAAHLAAAGVELASDPVVLPRTPSALARIGADGHPAYELDVSWRLAPLELPASEPACVGTGSFAAVLDDGVVVELLRRWRGRALTFYDVNVRPVVTGAGAQVRDRVEALLGAADLAKVSEEDLDLLWPGADHDHLVAGWLGLGVRAVLLSRGAAGASWVSAGRRVDVPAPEVAVVDTVGAGDSLTSAVLHGLLVRGSASDVGLDALSDDEVGALLEFAVRAAAVTVGRSGGDPPRLDEL